MSRPGSTRRAARVAKPPPSWWRLLGAGLVTGAADDDPSGIATYSHGGAQWGFSLAWTLLLTYPLMVVVQSISAQIGRVTGRAIAGNLRVHYAGWLLQSTVALLYSANTLNLGADLGAMAAASRLLAPLVPAWSYVVLYGLLCTVGPIIFKHPRYVLFLKWLSLSLLSYVAVLAALHIHWLEVLEALFLPRLRGDAAFWTAVVAILGTTISPYLFFWQAAQEVEDTKVDPEREPLVKQPAQAPSALRRMQLDTLVGMGLSNIVALAILVAAGGVLHRPGIPPIETAAEAAQALRPIAGPYAFALFALGIVSTGLLSVPVLAASAAYSLGEARRWPVGLERDPLQAKAFYGALALATFLGAALNLFNFNPIKALLWAAVINGMVAAPIMVCLMLMAVNPRVMGAFCISRAHTILGWVATLAMAAATLVFCVTSLRG